MLNKVNNDDMMLIDLEWKTFMSATFLPDFVLVIFERHFFFEGETFYSKLNCRMDFFTCYPGFDDGRL